MKRTAILTLIALLFVSIVGFVPNAAANSGYHINAGGSDFTDGNGTLFVADKLYVAGDFGATQARTYSFSDDIVGTDDDALYQTIRNGWDFDYIFDIPNDDYDVTLYFMDPWATSSGFRAFDVSIEGTLVLDNFDVFDTAGGQFTAHSETFTATVSDGQLNIEFDRALRTPLVSAISVSSTSPPTPEPEITVSPTSLDFGDVDENTTSDLVVNIANDGTADLNVSSLSTDNGLFTVESPNAPVVIAAGNNTDVTVRFSPVAAGAQSGTLSIVSDDADEGTVSVTLDGNGVTPPPNEPDINVTPTSLSFGDVNNGTSSDLSFTIENTGTQDLNISAVTSDNGLFTISGIAPPTVVAAGNSTSVTVSFSPVADGAQSGNITISSDDPDEGSVVVAVDGTGVTPPPNEPEINVSPTSLDFGSITTGTSSDMSFTIENTGTDDLNVSAVTSSDASFTISGIAPPTVIAPGNSETVTVSFSPAADGAYSGTIDVASDDADESTVSVAVTGSGSSTPAVAYRINSGGGDYTTVGGDLFVADKAYTAGDFGYTGNIRSFSFNNAIANTDDDVLYQDMNFNVNLGYQFDLDNGNYDVTLYFMEPFQSAAGERLMDITVEGVLLFDDYDVFAEAGGQYTAVAETFTVEVTDGALNIALVRDLRAATIAAVEVVSQGGGGTGPTDQEINVSPLSVAFGTVTVGSSLDSTVTIENQGGTTLNVSNITSDNGQFTIVSPIAPFDVNANNSTNVTIRFTPTSETSESGNLTISSNDADEPTVVVTMTGDGTNSAVVSTYTNVTSAAGLSNSHNINTAICLPTNNPPIGNGAAWGDYDGDGDIDVYVTNQDGANWLYSNDGDGTFTDMASAAGVSAASAISTGATFIDYDNDGDQDLWVGGHGGNIFYSNDGDGTFTDATAASGLGDAGRSIAAGWADFNEDGFLDVYIAKHKFCAGDDRQEDKLFVNNGDGTFTDVTTAYLCNGVAQCDDVMGLAFVPGWIDYDNDGDQDLFLVNDDIGGAYQPHKLFRNDGSDGSGGWNFTEVAAASDAEYSMNGMGLAVGDYNGDGTLDVAISNMGAAILLSNDGDGTFSDQSSSTIVGSATSAGVTWGTAFFDHDNDGDLDLYFTNGSLGGGGFANIFLDNNGAAVFTDQSAATNLDDGGKARGLAINDFNGDGFVDVLVLNYGGVPALLENDGNGNNWLSVTVEGTDSNRDGIGTRLILTAGGNSQIREISSGASHGGGDQRIALFGLGSETSGTLVVQWPNGEVENLGSVSAGQQLNLTEPPASTGGGTTYIDITAQVGITAVDTLPSGVCGVPAGNGIAFADYDNDGDIDAYITSHDAANSLYRNEGDTDFDGLPNFTNQAASAGVQLSTSDSMSAVFIDYDNDGDQDLYVTNDGGNNLFANDGDGTFTDVTAASGTADDGRAVTSAWADFNGDSYLDFYVAKHQACVDDTVDALYMSNGDGTFTDVTSYLCEGASTCQAVEGLGFSPSFLDYDNDGDLDLYLVNDDIGGNNTPNVLWRNDGDDGNGGWDFTDVSVASGANTSLNGMGQGVGDYNNDGWLDLAFSNGQPGRLLENNGDGTFTDVAVQSGITTIVNHVTWGTAFFDYDNDGDLDLWFAAGNVAAQTTDFPNYMLENNGDETFSDVSAASGLDNTGRSRSGSMVDINGDGFVDLMSGNFGGAYTMYLNDGANQGNNNHWLTITVEGTESNRDGIGTRINVTAGGVTQIREINSGPTHGGGDYRAAYVGLGANTSATVEIVWPNGVVENLGVVTADQQLHRVEPSSISEPDIDVVSTADFGDAETGTSRDKLVDVTNTGTTTLTLSSMTTNNGVFTVVTGTPVDIAPGATSKINLRFSPTSDGVENGDLTINSNDPDEASVVVALTGNGVTAASTTFVDVIASAGIDPTHTLSSTCSPPVGAGSAWADYDNDGDIDVYITDHGAANNLYRNDGDTDFDGIPNFTDVAVAMGLDDAAGVGHATNWIDYDNDGDQDLYVSNWGASFLYQNQLIENGSVSFVDVTTTAGLIDDGRTITAAWADYDNDGHLDVYLAKHAYCGGSDPRNFDKLYHSNGDGTFTDVTATAMCSSCDPIDHSLGFAAGWFDYDNDGDLDLYVVNDILQGDGSGGSENYHNVMWRNNGNGTFTEVSSASGTDIAVNGMGLGIGDLDNDGDFDIAFSDVGASTVLSNNGDTTYSDISGSSNGGTGSLTWGTAFFDYDNDGWVDLFFASGLIGVGGVTPDIFLQNNQNGTFTDISVSSGLNNSNRGRHAAMVDFDQDGLVDLFVGNYGTPAALYQNRADVQGNTNNWLYVTVEGTDSNRDGIGTRLTFTSGGVTQIREINSGATHGGGDYRAAYFGLGTATSGTLTIEWPNGESETIAIGSGDINQYRHEVEPAAGP